MQDFSLTKADGQSEQLCGLSKLGDNMLEITLCVGHECTIFCEESFKNELLVCLFWHSGHTSQRGINHVSTSGTGLGSNLSMHS